MTKRKPESNKTEDDDTKQPDPDVKVSKKMKKKPINDDDLTASDEQEENPFINEGDPSDRFPSSMPVKKTKKRNKNNNKDTESIVQTQPNPDQRIKVALKYLKTWYKHRDEWKFQKVRQMCLLQHMYDKSKIPDKKFKRLLKYLEGLSGASRERTIKEAGELVVENEMEDTEDVKKDSEESSEIIEKRTKLERATQILQVLS